MPVRKIYPVFLFLLVFPGAGISFSQAITPEPPPAAVMGAPGILQATPLFGRGATGWEISLDEPLQVGGHFYLRLPVDPDGFNLVALGGKRVKATGLLELRRGAQAGEFITVLRLTGVEPAP